MVLRPIYNLVVKRTSTYFVAVAVTVFVFERGFDLAADGIFNTVNKGVSGPYNLQFLT